MGRKIMSAKLFVFTLALASTQALSLRVQKVRAPDVNECMDGTSDWFSNIALNVQPWPVEIAAGKTITLDGAIDIMQEIEVGSGLNLKLTLITAIGNLNIGSCDYDVQHLLDTLKGADGGEEICNSLMAEGQDCNLPLMPGSYAKGDEAIVITLPDIPPVLEPFLKGTIKAQAIGKKPDGSAVACLEVMLELE